MYTLEELQSKTLKELKEIGFQLNVTPDGDRRYRQNWIDTIAGVQPTPLQLLEVSPGVEPVAEAIEFKFGRIIYSKPADKPIAPAVENSPGVSFDPEEFRHEHATEIESYCKSFMEADRPPNRGDNGRDRLETEAKVSQSAIPQTGRFTPGIELDPSRAKHQWITFSARFLGLYPPYFGEVNYKADATGQLNLLEPDIEDEPPDPDDFESLDAFRDAMARWDAENPEPLAVSMDSMCEWAPCPDEWYEPSESFEVMELLLPISSSDTLDFFIPVFGVAGDRTNRNDEPPTAGIGIRRPLPKPPSFPSVFAESRCPCGAMPAAQCDGTTATHIYPDRIVFTPCYKQLDAIGVRGSSSGGDAIQ